MSTLELTLTGKQPVYPSGKVLIFNDTSFSENGSRALRTDKLLIVGVGVGVGLDEDEL